MSKYGPPPEVYAPNYGHQGFPPPGHQGYAPPGNQGYGHYQPPAPAPAAIQNPSQVFAPTMNQPQTQATNIVVNAGGAGSTRINTRPWSTNLCGCMEDIGGCVCVICCPLCQLMALATRMNELFCLPCLVPQSLMGMRIKLRTANKIKGGIFSDCMMTSCCPLMTVCQMKREMDNIDLKKPATLL